MKREIKFRAWGNKQMYYSNDEQTVWMGGMEVSVNSNKGKIIHDFIGMQFTGLKDKNGKEIYEGDIVKLCDINSKHNDSIFEIGFRMGSFEMQTNDGLPPLSFIYMAVQLRSHNKIERDYQAMNHIEVIGNIYENPELLKP